MPSGRKPDGDAPLSNAERQARYRLRHQMGQPAAVARRHRAPTADTHPEPGFPILPVRSGIDPGCVRTSNRNGNEQLRGAAMVDLEPFLLP
jgi:hypothetical protein